MGPTLLFALSLFSTWPIRFMMLGDGRLPEIRRTRRTCPANFENVRRRAPRSPDKMSSEEKMNLCLPVILSLKMSDESLKCPAKNLRFTGQNVRRVTKSFREAWDGLTLISFGYKQLSQNTLIFLEYVHFVHCALYMELTSFYHVFLSWLSVDDRRRCNSMLCSKHNGEKWELEGNGRQPIQTIVSLLSVCTHVFQSRELPSKTFQVQTGVCIIVADLPFVVMNRLTPIHWQMSCSLFSPI